MYVFLGRVTPFERVTGTASWRLKVTARETNVRQFHLLHGGGPKYLDQEYSRDVILL